MKNILDIWTLMPLEDEEPSESFGRAHHKNPISCSSSIVKWGDMSGSPLVALVQIEKIQPNGLQIHSVGP